MRTFNLIFIKISKILTECVFPGKLGIFRKFFVHKEKSDNFDSFIDILKIKKKILSILFSFYYNNRQTK